MTIQYTIFCRKVGNKVDFSVPTMTEFKVPKLNAGYIWNTYNSDGEVQELYGVTVYSNDEDGAMGKFYDVVAYEEEFNVLEFAEEIAHIATISDVSNISDLSLRYQRLTVMQYINTNPTATVISVFRCILEGAANTSVVLETYNSPQECPDWQAMPLSDQIRFNSGWSGRPLHKVPYHERHRQPHSFFIVESAN